MSARNAAIKRIRIITAIVLLVALILVARLYQLQIVNFDVYVARGESQYVHTANDLYDRGSIYFTAREGEMVSAATVKSGYVMALDPSKVTDPLALYESVKQYISIDKDTFVHRATLPERIYVEVATELSEEHAGEIRQKELDGVGLYRQRWRYYPGAELAARTVGFVGYEGKDEEEQLVGLYGLERYYDDTLRKEGQRLSVNFFAELFTNLGNLVFDTKKSKQGDVVTTIEPTVARLLQNELAKAHEQWNSELTGGIIIDPKTGAIYAMDAAPTFNPNERGGSTLENFANPLVDSRYELGSIIKALTMAAGIDSGAVSAGTTYFDSGSIELDTLTINNYDKVGRGTVNMQAVLSQSLNTGVAFVVKTMGKDRFREYFEKLRLGSETGIDLVGEIHGDIENLNSPRAIEYATASYGHGIALTPIAAARALAALGNGGKLVTPHIASRINYDDGTSKEILFPEGERVWSEETSEEITRMLVRVVDEALRNGAVKLPEHSVAAKTGTALLVNKDGSGYYEDRFLHSFFGYFPAYDPQFLVFLYTVDPKGVTFASDTLTEPFMNIAKFLINYYNIPPDR
jgi:stage V sporulation protein D (sporulation-specific penicillin-binding protein)